MHKVMKVLGISLVLLLMAALAFGQTETGQITGAVTDSSGAVVPNAKVTATAVDTGVVREAKTNAAGLYTFPALKPTTYKVVIEAQGFDKYQRTVTVYVASSVEVAAKLVVGSSTTVVEVSASSTEVTVNAENSTLSETITGKQLDILPTSADHDPYSLVRMANNTTSDSNGVSSTRGTGYSMNGARSASTSILLDGAENVDTFSATVGQAVPLDSVQEFSVLTSNFGAEFGRASGGVVNLVTKSGTNQFHGSVYEYNRISALASNTAYNDERGIAQGKYTRNNYGFSVGGPIIKNKLFFFENLEWIKVRSNAPDEASIIDPDSYSQLGASSQNFFTTYGALRSGLKTLSTTPCLAGSTLNCRDVTWSVPADAGGGYPQNNWNEVAKVDWNISSKTTLTGRYAGYHLIYFPGVVADSAYAGYDTGETMFKQNYTATLTHIFSPSLVSTSKVVYNRLYDNQGLGTAPVGPTLYSTSSIPVTSAQVPLIFPGYLPSSPGAAIPFGGPQNLYQFYQAFSYSKGEYQLKFGGQYIDMRDNRTFGAYDNAEEYLGISAGGLSGALANLISGNLYQFTSAIDPQGKYPCYKDIATGATIQNDACTVNLPVQKPSFARHYHYNDMSFYGQDTWKVTPRFTVNAGLRWEYYGVQHNANPNLDSNFVLGPGATPMQKVRSGAVELAKNGGYFWKPQYGNFGPIVGFAWDIFGDGKTALRGGFRIGYERNFGNVTFNSIQNPPNYGVVSLISPDDIPSMPVYTDNMGPLSGSGVTKALPSVSLRAIDQNIKTASTQTWNMSIEHQVFKNSLVTLGYAGSHGVHLYDISDTNLPQSGNAFYGDPTTKTRGNLQYSDIGFRSDRGYSKYNALLAGFKANDLAKLGLNLQVNYQWAHTLDNQSSTFSDGYTADYGTGYLDAFNPSLDYGNADFDVRHHFLTSVSWDLPFGKGTKGGVRQIVTGWTIGGIFEAQSGSPFSIWDGFGSNGYRYPMWTPASGTTVTKPGMTRNGDGTYNYITLPMDGGYVANAGNATGFAMCSELYHQGTCTYTYDGTPYPHRNQFHGPNNWKFDLQASKSFKIYEKVGVELRGEFYNILNHHNQYIYGDNLDISGFDDTAHSIETRKTGDNRNVQLGAKITF